MTTLLKKLTIIASNILPVFIVIIGVYGLFFGSILLSLIAIVIGLLSSSLSQIFLRKWPDQEIQENIRVIFSFISLLPLLGLSEKIRLPNSLLSQSDYISTYFKNFNSFTIKTNQESILIQSKKEKKGKEVIITAKFNNSTSGLVTYVVPHKGKWTHQGYEIQLGNNLFLNSPTGIFSGELSFAKTKKGRVHLQIKNCIALKQDYQRYKDLHSLYNNTELQKIYSQLLTKSEKDLSQHDC